MSLIKETFQSILLSRQDKFYWDCQMGKYEIPPEGRGHETVTFRKNQKVKSSGLGSRKAGLIGSVEETYKQNGFWYHVVCWDSGGKSTERQKDLTFC